MVQIRMESTADITCSVCRALGVVVPLRVVAWLYYYLCHLQEYIIVYVILLPFTPNWYGYHNNRFHLVLFVTYHAKCYVCLTSQNFATRVSTRKELRREADVLWLVYGRTYYRKWQWRTWSRSSTSTTCAKTQPGPSAFGLVARPSKNPRANPYS